MRRGKEYVELRERGLTYQQIADRYGVSRQAVQQGMVKEQNRKPGAVMKLKYPGLRDWCLENDYRLSELERLCGFTLRSKHINSGLSQRKINRILEVTGLTYEEAFSQ